MATKAFQKIYTKITQITKATCSLKATGVGYDELATVNGKLAQVVKIAGDDVTLQVFEGTEGIPEDYQLVPVETGIADSTNTEILGGLEEGTEVFLAGPSDLYADMSDDGMSVG